MDNQELFNKVVTHLRAQGERAANKYGSCQYRIEKDGRVLRCAIGCLIPDEKYSPQLEGVDVSLSARVFEAAGLDESNLQLASKLQNTHDLANVGDWEDHFYELAREFALTVPPRA